MVNMSKETMVSMNKMLENIEKKTNLIYQLDKKVSVIEEHIRQRNGQIDKHIANSNRAFDELWKKVNNNTSFRFWASGAIAVVSAIVCFIASKV